MTGVDTRTGGAENGPPQVLVNFRATYDQTTRVPYEVLTVTTDDLDLGDA
jgi:hypothetical protein